MSGNPRNFCRMTHSFFKRKRKEGGCWKEHGKPFLSGAAAGWHDNAEGGESMALKALVLLRSAGCDHSSLMHCFYNELGFKK